MKFKNLATFLLLCGLCVSGAAAHAKQAVSFSAADGVPISADLYAANAELARDVVIVLFHQARSSRGEYAAIAPRLAQMGYTALAVDQRSGASNGGVRNQTHAAARDADKDTGFLDARQDLLAAVSYAKASLEANQVVVWGSSYSASLVLSLAGLESGWVDGALAFSPGEYFGGELSVADSVEGIAVPTFITSARSEWASWSSIRQAIPASHLTTLHAEGAGRHGSSTLLPPSASGTQEYWHAVEAFLEANF